MFPRFLSVSVLTFFSCVCTAQEDRTFKSEVLSRWQEVASKVDTAVLKCRKEFKVSKGDKTDFRLLTNESVSFAMQRGKGSVADHETLRPEEKKEGFVRKRSATLKNPEYRAKIIESNLTRDSWKVDAVNPGNAANDQDDFLACPWTVIGTVNLLDRMPRPTFKISKTEPVTGRDGVKRMYFVFSESGNYRPETSESVIEGYIDLDTIYHYTPVAYKFKVSNKSSDVDMHGVLTYADRSSSCPKLISTKHEEDAKSARKGLLFGREEAVYEIVEYNEATTVEAFYLSHYQLPEPVGVSVPVSRTRTVEIIILLTLILGSLSVIFAYLRRRAVRKNIPHDPRRLTPQ